MARLYVDGLLAWERGRPRCRRPPARKPLAPLEPISPFRSHGWRGHRARLAFASTDASSHFFAADRIRSRRWQRQRVLDDFETGADDPAVWAETFGARAGRQSPARRGCGGLALAQGRGAASSLGLAGPRRILCSRRFRVEHQRLAFSVFDFGDARTRVELAVEGRAGRGRFRRRRQLARSRLLDWDLGGLAGSKRHALPSTMTIRRPKTAASASTRWCCTIRPSNGDSP